MNATEASFEGVGLLEEAVDSEPIQEESYSHKQSRDPSMNNDRIRGGGRLDYMLQEKELESANECISAFAAHSSYWESRDLSLFIAKQLSMQQRTDTHVPSNRQILTLPIFQIYECSLTTKPLFSYHKKRFSQSIMYDNSN